MVITDDFFDSSLQIHHDQAFALFNQIEKLKLTSYPTPELSNFINELSTICKLILNKFNEVSSYSEIKVYRQSLNNLQQIVSYLSQANTTHNPMEVMIPAKELILRFGDETLFFTQPVWILNYAIGDVWTKLSENIVKLFPELTLNSKRKILIQFPIIHKDDVLLGCVMGHELGHYFDLHSGLNLSAQLLPQLLQHENINHLKPYLEIKILNQTIILNNETETRIKQQIIINLLSGNYLINWLNEFIADIAGILLYGPSSHFSGDSIFTFSSLTENGELIDSYSTTHPRSSIRSIVRLRTFSKLGYDQKLNSEIQSSIEVSKQKWIKAKTYIETNYIDGRIQNDLVYRLNLQKESYELIENILLDKLDVIIDFVVNTIPEDLHYSADKYQDIVPKLSKKISNFIPPNELLGEPVDSISILNAGWYAYILDKEKLRESLSENEQDYNIREMINNLIKKALTSAHIHRRWKDVDSQ